MRCFLAFQVPEKLKTRLGERILPWQTRLGQYPIRWTRRDSIHLTLKFLGEIRKADLHPIRTSVQAVIRGSKQFKLVLEGSGSFPNPSRPRVLWAGVSEPTGALSDLQAGLEAALEELGFDREKRPYHPHLTLGRVGRDVTKDQLQGLGDELGSMNLGRIGSWQPRELFLFRSELRPEGARYSILQNFQLPEFHLEPGPQDPSGSYGAAARKGNSTR